MGVGEKGVGQAADFDQDFGLPGVLAAEFGYYFGAEAVDFAG